MIDQKCRCVIRQHRLEKERENRAALAVLPDLLLELDQLELQQRLLVVVEGVLAANIFDWWVAFAHTTGAIPQAPSLIIHHPGWELYVSST